MCIRDSYNTGILGEIPPEIGNLTNSTWLGLDYNHLTGEIPPEICNLVDSSILLSYNQFCPPYPECLTEGGIGYQDTSECPECSYIGDLNGDESIDVLDVVELLNCVLGLCNDNDECIYVMDINEDGNVNILDVVQLVNIVLDT